MAQSSGTDTEEASAELGIGTIVAEQYRVVSHVGDGLRTSVYTVRLEPVGKELRALKLLNTEWAKERSRRLRFEHEIQTALSVKHPHLLQAVERVEVDSRPGLVMEYADGGTLKDLLLEEAPVSLDLALRLTGQLCAALSELHGAGVIHRDLKPRNVFLTAEGEVRLGEFGLALLPGQARSGPVGQVVGAIEYVSPEYIQTGRIDERADLYAVGLLLYQLVTGNYPYEREEQPIDSLMKRLTCEPIPVAKFCPDCPEEIAEVITRSLAHDPEKRFATAMDFAQTLADCLSVLKKRHQVPLPLPEEQPEPRPSPPTPIITNYRTLPATEDDEFPGSLDFVEEIYESGTRRFTRVLLTVTLVLISAGTAYEFTQSPEGQEFLRKFTSSQGSTSAARVAPSASGKREAVMYTVVKGDTAERIASMFGTSSEELLKLNNISDPRRLYAGQVIQIPVNN